MSVLTEEHVSIQVRQKLRLPPTATLDLQPLVPVALNQLAVQIASDPNKREWLFTDPATTTVAVTAGVADLTVLISSANLLIDFIQYGFVYLGAVTTQPLIWLNQVGMIRMVGGTDNIFSHVTRQGNSLLVRGPNATPPTGTLYLAVSKVSSLAGLPEALTDDLVNTLARLVVMPAANEDAA